MEYLNKNIDFAWHSAMFLLVCLALFIVASFSFSLFNFRIKLKEELTDKDNLAFYLAYIPYFMGFLAVIGGVMHSGGTNDFQKELLYTFIYGVVGILGINIVAWISDKLMYSKIAQWKEIIEGNLAIGVLKGANYLSTGIIIGGVMLTEVNRPVQGLVFLVLALVLAVIGFVYYNLITPFNIRSEIEKGNIAVAASTSGAIIAFSILIHAGFQIEHTTWVDSIIGIGVDVLGGLIILPLIRFVLDKIFIRNRKITDELINQEIPNLGLGIFEASAYIGGALLFIWCWNL